MPTWLNILVIDSYNVTEAVAVRDEVIDDSCIPIFIQPRLSDGQQIQAIVADVFVDGEGFSAHSGHSSGQRAGPCWPGLLKEMRCHQAGWCCQDPIGVIVPSQRGVSYQNKPQVLWWPWSVLGVC